MRTVAIVNRTRDSVLASAVRVADQWWQRARGFLGRPEPKNGEGLLLNPCRAVHMIGMQYGLDVVFLDRQGRVLALYPRLGPGRRSSWHARARYAIELPAGTIHDSGTQVDDLIAWLPADAADAADAASPGRNGKLDHAAAPAGRSNQDHT